MHILDSCTKDTITKHKKPNIVQIYTTYYTQSKSKFKYSSLLELAPKFEKKICC